MNDKAKSLCCQVDEKMYNEFKRAAIINYGFHRSTRIALTEAINDYIEKTKKKLYIPDETTLF